MEKLRLLPMSSRCVNNDDFEPLFSELLHALQGDGDRICLSVRPKVRDLGFGGRLASLIKCTGTEGIRANDSRFEPSFLVVHCELCTCRGFAVTLFASSLGWTEGSVWDYVLADRQP